MAAAAVTLRGQQSGSAGEARPPSSLAAAVWILVVLLIASAALNVVGFVKYRPGALLHSVYDSTPRSM